MKDDKEDVSSLPKSGGRLGCFRFGSLPLLALALIVFVGIPTWKAVHGWWEIRSALANAKSVELVHFNPYADHFAFTPRIVYGMKELKPEDFGKVLAAFPPLPDFGMPSDPYECVFDPHHKIVITDASGHETVIRVCFICDHVQIGEKGDIFCTPLLWRPLLHKFFDDEGLPFTPDRYMEDYLNSTKDVKIPSAGSQ